MRIDFIDPFVEAALDVLRNVLDAPVSRGRLSLEKGPAAKEGFVVGFGLMGDLEGTVLFDASENTVLKIAGHMNREEFDSVHSLVLDSVTELANMIIGRSVTILNDMGFSFRITPPMLCHGKELGICPKEIESLVVSVGTAYGDLMVNVSVREAA